MRVKFSQQVKEKFPDLTIATLTTKNLRYREDNPSLEGEKKEVIRYIQENYQDVENLKTVKSYNQFFKQFGKVYPIQYQIKSILAGKGFPSTIKVVEAMFMAELTFMFLTAGHDLDNIAGELEVKLAKGGEKYQKINSKDQILKPDDIICEDRSGIISSVLYGPDFRTRITQETKNCLFFSYFPYGEADKEIRKYFDTLLGYVNQICDVELLESNIQISV